MPSRTFDFKSTNSIQSSTLSTNTTSTSFGTLSSITMSSAPIKPVKIGFKTGSFTLQGSSIASISASFQIKRATTVIAEFKMAVEELTLASNELIIPASSFNTIDFTPSTTGYSIEWKVDGASMTLVVNDAVFYALEF